MTNTDISAPELIDSHCHLDFDYAPKTAEDIVREALSNGVSTLITIATEIPTLKKIVAISERFENVYHTAGVHPHDTKEIKPGDLSILEAAAKHPKCRAIGEIGLDYHYDNSPRETQREQFKAQLDLALKVQLPVVIHARDAEDDMLIALKNYVARADKKITPGVIHCFTGTKRFGKACIDLGFFISFSGVITFKKSEDPVQARLFFDRAHCPHERVEIRGSQEGHQSLCA